MIFKTKKHTFGGARQMTEEEKAFKAGLVGVISETERQFQNELEALANQFQREVEAQADDDYAVRVKG